MIFQILLVLSVNLNECACYREAERLALACETATVKVHFDVIFLCCVKHLQRLLYDILQYC